MERTGNFLDGSVFSEKTTAVYRLSKKKKDTNNIELSVAENKSKEQSLTISLNRYPMIKLRGSLPDENNVFHLTSLEYLAGNTHGWNEFTLQLMGSGSLFLGENASFENIKEIEPIQITHGKIHRFDTRITGDEALAALRNRYERINALTEWMLSSNGPKEQSFKQFDKFWKPVLFPEISAARKRHKNWRQEGDHFERAEDIRWNTGYTERVFPEELRPVRNAGTLLRDWEEAFYWIYYQYEWEGIKELLSRQIILQKIK